jgi:integral membrane protein
VLKTPVGRLRLVGFCEGVSFLVLLGVAMPLKYLANLPQAVLVVGWVHGLLFMLFVAAVANVAAADRWPRGRVLLALAAAVLPFGPFVLDARLRRDEQDALERTAATGRV